MNAVTPIRATEPPFQLPPSVADAYENYASKVRRARAALLDGRAGRNAQVALDLAAGRAWGRYLLVMAREEQATARRASETGVAGLVRAYNAAYRQDPWDGDDLDNGRAARLNELDAAIRRTKPITEGDMSLKLLMAVAALADGNCLNEDAAAELVVEARLFGLEVEVA